MADLRTELQELVEHDPMPSPPPDLWVRGVRRRRRMLAQRSLAALAAAVVAVLVLLSVDTSLVSPPPAAPVDVPASRLHAPNRIYVPSRWMVDTHRPPGPLAVLSAAQRASWWFGTREGWFGISAVDGSYHWLDLPHILASWPPVLSPDGTKIGYALSGDPSAMAFSHMVGFAVYDTRTGHLSTTASTCSTRSGG
jgi:hypothetical protein